MNLHKQCNETIQVLRDELADVKEQNKELLQALLDSKNIPVSVGVQSTEGRIHYMDDEAMIEAELNAKKD